MNGDQKFWLITWGNVMLFILLAMCALFYRAHTYDKLKVEALSKAVDPIALACAETISPSSQAKTDLILCMEKVRK